MLGCCWLGGRKGNQPVKNMGGWWRWSLVSPDGVAPSLLVSVSASVNLPLHHKVQIPEVLFWQRLTQVVPKKGRKMVVVVVWNILGIPEWIYAKLTWETCLVPRSDEFEGQGQRSPGTKKWHFSALSVACVWFMFGKTSLASSFPWFLRRLLVGWWEAHLACEKSAPLSPTVFWGDPTHPAVT